MRKILIVAIVATLFAGCIKDQMGNGPKKSGDRVENLIVPASFDWKTTSNVKCEVNSPTIARVAISTAPAAKPFATFFAGGKLQPVELNIPQGVETLYISYQKTDNTMSAPQPMQRNGKGASYQLPSGNRPFDDSDMDTQTDPNVVYIPAAANGWGTMMFEDMWPSYGDYDFNDFVFNYKVQLHLTGNNMVKAMQIGIVVRACSGSFPYELYLQMHGVTNPKIGDIEVINVSNSTTAAISLLPAPDPNKNRAVFRFDGIRKNINNPKGAKWMNTEPGYEIATDKLVQLSTVIYFTEPISLEKIGFSGLDFFLGQVNEQGAISAEIHRCDFEPINSDYYYSKAENMSDRNFYKSKDNLIWGVNIPVEVSQTYEKVNFLDAYPEFKTWVESGGVQKKDWYINCDPKYTVAR